METTVEIVRWMVLRSPEGPPLIVVVVDDEEDDALAGAIAREGSVPAEHFAATWATSLVDGMRVVDLRLVALDGPMERLFFTDSIDRELIAVILDPDHLVAILPLELAGEASTAKDVVPRLGGSMIVGVEHRAPELTGLLDDFA